MPTAGGQRGDDIVAFLCQELRSERAARAELQEQLWELSRSADAAGDAISEPSHLQHTADRDQQQRHQQLAQQSHYAAAIPMQHLGGDSSATGCTACSVGPSLFQQQQQAQQGQQHLSGHSLQHFSSGYTPGPSPARTEGLHTPSIRSFKQHPAAAAAAPASAAGHMQTHPRSSLCSSSSWSEASSSGYWSSHCTSVLAAGHAAAAAAPHPPPAAAGYSRLPSPHMQSATHHSAASTAAALHRTTVSVPPQQPPALPAPAAASGLPAHPPSAARSLFSTAPPPAAAAPPLPAAAPPPPAAAVPPAFTALSHSCSQASLQTLLDAAATRQHNRMQLLAESTRSSSSSSDSDAEPPELAALPSWHPSSNGRLAAGDGEPAGWEPGSSRGMPAAAGAGCMGLTDSTTAAAGYGAGCAASSSSGMWLTPPPATLKAVRVRPAGAGDSRPSGAMHAAAGARVGAPAAAVCSSKWLDQPTVQAAATQHPVPGAASSAASAAAAAAADRHSCCSSSSVDHAVVGLSSSRGPQHASCGADHPHHLGWAGMQQDSSMLWGHACPDGGSMQGLAAGGSEAGLGPGSSSGAGGRNSLASFQGGGSGPPGSRQAVESQPPGRVGLTAAGATGGTPPPAAPPGVPGCGSCSALAEALLEAEFLQELSTAQLMVVREERDLLAQQHESLLQLLAQSSCLGQQHSGG